MSLRIRRCRSRRYGVGSRGDHLRGLGRMAASNGACAGLSRSAGVRKYLREAASAPMIPSPQSTVFKYIAKNRNLNRSPYDSRQDQPGTHPQAPSDDPSKSLSLMDSLWSGHVSDVDIPCSGHRMEVRRQGPVSWLRGCAGV